MQKTKVKMSEVVDTLRLCCQRLGNAAQGKLSQETAMIAMRRVVKLMSNMEDLGVEEVKSDTFDNRPE